MPYTNLTKLTTVADSVDDIVTVADNISSIDDVITNVIPNMTEILLASDNASTASTKADEASDSATEAYNWAQYTEDSLVPEGNLVDEYSAYHYAQKAGDSADAASSSAASAEAAWDSFDDRYLGSKVAAPTTDNDGDPLVEGMIYWNSTGKKFQVYDGVGWNDVYFEVTGSVTSFNTRTGAITLTNTDVTNAVGVDLSGVEAGAEVNNISNIDATDLTDAGNSALHYHSSDRNRTNHTGTQLMATISDAGDSATLDVGTSAGTVAAGDHNHSGVYEPADSTILKDADIGVTVQAYSSSNALTTDITYENLNSNGDVGTGTTQVAAGDHLHTSVYEPADSTILKDADIGVTVQGYDADTAKTDVANLWTAHQTFQEISETVYALTGTGIDTGNGTIQIKTLGANTTFTDALTSGQSVKLTLSNSGSYTVTWPTITWISATEAAGSAPTVSSSYATHIEVWKEGSILYGALVGYSS